MRKTILTYVGFFLSMTLAAQSKQDYVWLFGFYSDLTEIHPSFGGGTIDFNTQPPSIYTASRIMNINPTSAAICSEEGQLLAYSNGAYIANADHDSIANSNHLSLDGALGYETDGLEIPQGALILPIPELSQQFIMIHQGYYLVEDPVSLDLFFAGNNLYYTIFDLSLNNEKGEVTLKNEPLIQDTTDLGKIVATRHSNGRDWWIVSPTYQSGTLYRFLLTPQGVQALVPQNLGVNWKGDWGQAVFSPDGSKYVHTVGGGNETYLTIADFDRNSGTFSNVMQATIVQGGYAGVAISPNSRFLYHSINQAVCQYDLSATDVIASRDTVALYDGYEEYLADFGVSLPTNFFSAKLAPDNKIYIVPLFTSGVMHVINQPDLPGQSCDLVQRQLALPRLNRFSLPNYPNFRLGPLVGSSGDTLRPIAIFTYMEAGANFSFRDTSLRNPTTWYWDFGDGSTSTEQYPQHVYQVDGIYNVCLIVSNAYGSDTLCQEIMITISHTQGVNGGNIHITCYPNPVSTTATLSFSEPEKIRQMPLVFSLRDALGSPLRATPITLYDGQASFSIDFSTLPAGVYYYTLQASQTTKSHLEWRGKLIKQ